MKTSARLQAILERLDLASYADVFRREKIDDANLHELTETKLRAIGLPSRQALRILDALMMAGVPEAGTPDGGPSEGKSPSSRRIPAEPVGEHRQVTVLYCDLVQSTELTHAMGNEGYAAFYAEYLATCERIIRKFGQEISSQKGDGIGVCFGLRKASEDDTERAMRAAMKLSEAVSRLPTSEDSTASCRIGIATGAVAVVSSEAFGDVMNLASRLQDIGGPGDIIVADATRRICGDAYYFIDMGYRHLKGFAPQRVWRLGGPIPGMSRFEATRGHNLSPLVGRKSELQLLRQRWRLAREGKAQVVFVEGEAGIGKSRLVRELMAEAAGDSAIIQSYQCLLRRQGAAYYPVIDQLERASGINRRHSTREKLERLRALNRGWGMVDEEAVGVFATLLGIEQGLADAPAGITDLPDQMARAFVEQLKAIARQYPLLVIFEDLHWVDPSTAELLSRVISFIDSAALPILIALTHRPVAEEEEGAYAAKVTALGQEMQEGTHPCATKVTLGGLDRSESLAIIEHVAQGHPISPDVLQSIASRADDVPLFIEELTKYVLQFGKLHEIEGRRPILLEGIQPYLTGRLDGLGNLAKEVAQMGSVIGRRFTVQLLSRGLERETESLVPALDSLVRSGLVERQGTDAQAVYAFKHALVQDAAYASLFQRQKVKFHRRIAEALERDYPESARREPDVLAWHLTEAGEHLRAVDYWRMAGEAAIARSAMAEARRHFERGRQVIETVSGKKGRHSAEERARLEQLELELLAELGTAVYPLEGSSDKRLVAVFERVLDLASKQGRLDREFDAHLSLSNYYYVGGNLTQGEQHIEPCLRLAERSGDPNQLVSAHRIAGELAFYLGEMDRAVTHLRQSIAFYRDDRHDELLHMLGDDPGALARMYLSLSLWFRGEAREAFKCCEEGISAAEGCHHEYTLGQASFDAAWLHAVARRREGALRHAERAIKLCSNGKDEFRLYLGCASVISGWVSAMRGDITEGIGLMRRAMPLIEQTDAEICLSCFLPWLAEGLGRAGEVEEGLKIIERAHKTASERFYDAERMRIEGELRSGSDPVGARRCFAEALRISRQAGTKAIELRAGLALHDFEKSRDRKVDLQELLGHLLPWIDSEMESEETRRAKSLLGSLQGVGLHEEN